MWHTAWRREGYEKEIRGERVDVEALLWGAALTSPRYISLEPAPERIFCRLSSPPARTDLFAPLPPRRVPTIPVLGRPPSTFLYAEPYIAPEMLDREMEYERPYTNHRATVLPGAPFSFFFRFPFPPVSLSLSLSLLYLAASFLQRSSLSSVLWQLIISLIYRILVSLFIYLFYMYTFNIRVSFSFFICVCKFKSELEFTVHWRPSRQSNLCLLIFLLLLNICDTRFSH